MQKGGRLGGDGAWLVNTERRDSLSLSLSCFLISGGRGGAVPTMGPSKNTKDELFISVHCFKNRTARPYSERRVSHPTRRCGRDR